MRRSALHSARSTRWSVATASEKLPSFGAWLIIPQWTHIRTYLVKQESDVDDPVLSGQTPLRLVRSSDPDYQALLVPINQAEAATDTGSTLSALYEELAIYDKSEMERRTVRILSTLRFSKEQMTQPLKECGLANEDVAGLCGLC